MRATPRATPRTAAMARPARRRQYRRLRSPRRCPMVPPLPLQAPTSEQNRPVSVGGCLSVVRDHEDGPSLLLAQLSQQVEDLVAGRQVEVAGRLVGEDQHRFHGQGPGDRYPLHLASRQRVWSMVTPMGESQAVEEGG